ncbi:MAG: hypothetical protein NTY45_07385 [Elusimicrobia bacterium]|nr:hypothetical protein [Elusimicrobiota bacterium]
MKTLQALTAVLLLLSPRALNAASSVAIHYFDHEYRITFGLAGAVEQFAASTGTINLENVNSAITYTNGAKFVINGPEELGPAELGRTTRYTFERRLDIITGGNSLIVPPRDLLENFADTTRAAGLKTEQLPAEILTGYSPSGLKFRVLYVPSFREKRLWEPTFKMEHRLATDAGRRIFTSLGLPMGLDSPSCDTVEEASNKDSNLLLSLGASEAGPPSSGDAGHGLLLDELTAAGTDIAALDQPDLTNFWRLSKEGRVKLSSSAPEFVCSNVKISDPGLAGIIKPYVLREIAGTTVAFISLLPYNPVTLAALRGSPFAPWDPRSGEAFSALLAELRGKYNAGTVVAVTFSRKEDLGWLLNTAGVDVLIGPRTGETAPVRKNRVELANWSKETRFGPALMVFPDSSGAGRITLEFNQEGEFTAAEAAPRPEDASEPFQYQKKTEMKERIIKSLMGSGDALLPDPRRISLNNRPPFPIYAVPDFFNMAAGLLRKKFKAEIAVLKLTPGISNVLGDTPSSLVKVWLGPDEPVELVWVPGAFLRNFARKVPPAMNALAYYSPQSYKEKEYYAVSGIDAAGRVAGLPLSDGEYYLTALPSSLLAGKNGFHRRKGPPVTLHEAVTGSLRALKDGSPTREAWERAVKAEAANLPENRDIWRLNLRNLSLQMVNTSVSAGAGYAGVNESRLSAVDQTQIQGSGRLFSEFHSGKFRFDSGISADYGKLVLRPSGKPQVTTESVDQIILENELRYRLKSYNGALGALVIGPFATAAYDTEFSRATPLPLRKVLRGKAGLKMFEGTYVQEFYAGLTTEQVYTYSPARTQYAAETGFSLAWPVPGTALTLNADGTYRNFARSRFDTVNDLKERLELNFRLSTRLYGDITINPFASYFLTSGKKLGGSASNLTTGFSLEYSRLFKLKR